jgi:hypothetical protein
MDAETALFSAEPRERHQSFARYNRLLGVKVENRQDRRVVRRVDAATDDQSVDAIWLEYLDVRVADGHQVQRPLREVVKVVDRPPRPWLSRGTKLDLRAVSRKQAADRSVRLLRADGIPAQVIPFVSELDQLIRCSVDDHQPVANVHR